MCFLACVQPLPFVFECECVCEREGERQRQKVREMEANATRNPTSFSLSLSSQYIESPDVEKEVKRLLSTDAEAVSVRILFRLLQLLPMVVFQSLKS